MRRMVGASVPLAPQRFAVVNAEAVPGPLLRLRAGRVQCGPVRVRAERLGADCYVVNERLACGEVLPAVLLATEGQTYVVLVCPAVARRRVGRGQAAHRCGRMKPTNRDG